MARVKNTDFTTELNWWQKSLYYMVWGLLYVISLLPLSVLYVLSDGLYFLVYHVARYRKSLVRKNLRDSFPEKTEAELLVIEHKFYHFFCDYILETIKLTSMSMNEMSKRVKFNNIEYLNKCFEDGHNIAAYLGHYCNWEWVTSIGLQFDENVFVGQVYHILESPVFNALMLKIRSAMDTHSISMQIILRKIIETKREGTKMIIGFISDQVPFWNNIHHWLTFMNHPDTPVLTGTERLAKKYDFACVYFDVQRIKRGYYVCNIKPITEDPKQYSNWELTEMYFTELERTIRHQPEYWLWTHNRWKRTREQYNKMIDPQTGKLKF